jgi:hypothetical protein
MLADFSQAAATLRKAHQYDCGYMLAVLLSSAGLRLSANESGGQSAPFVARLKEIVWLQKINVG